MSKYKSRIVLVRRKELKTTNLLIIFTLHLVGGNKTMVMKMKINVILVEKSL